MDFKIQVVWLTRCFGYSVLVLGTLLLTSTLTYAQNWQFTDVQVHNADNTLTIVAQSLQTPYFAKELANVKYQCSSNGQVYPIHSCNNGSVSFTYDGIDYDFLLSLQMNLTISSWSVELSNRNKTLSLTSNSEHQDQLVLAIKQMPINELSQLLKQFIELEVGQTTGLLTADITVDLANTIIQANYKFDEFFWESADGNYVVVENQLQGNFTLRQNQQNFELQLLTDIVKGEGLFQDIYLIFTENPLTLNTFIQFDSQFNIIKSAVNMLAGDDIEFSVNIIDLPQEKFNIDFNINDLDRFNNNFLASYLEIIGIDDLSLQGQAHGQVNLEHGEIVKIDTVLSNLNLKMPAKKIIFKQFAADINWQKHGQTQISTFNWDSLLLAGMPIKKSSLTVNAVGQQLALLKNTELPIFDGSLLINNLELQDIFAAQISIDFQGELKPISIALITEKMGWAIMEGTISGKIPGMKKVGQSITFDGVLDLKLFDGNMRISKLAIERLFGIAPVIAADITFDKLNLQQITSTFDFGEITGLVTGYVKELRVTNWQPDRLDAYIQSVKTKGIKQTISQRAIDNISSIGGIQGALSRSFLRFFDDFKYKRIGIGCRLRNAICSMSGIKGSQNNYTLIEGKGIPSINIIGFRKHIDWQIFLDRLLTANY